MSIAPEHPPASKAKPLAPGRPLEIEAASNVYLVHPAARALATYLSRTAVTPNQVSIASVFASGCAAASYVAAPWPWNAFAGLALQFVWHVLDGADGDLARRTGRASPRGELIDGVCDHVSQGLIYIAFAIMAQRTVGGWAWAVAFAAAGSHFVQANAYETGRKAYRRFVYGAPWMRQTGAGEGELGGLLAHFYLAVSVVLSPGEAEVESAFGQSVDGSERPAHLYRDAFAPIVKTSGILASNTRTLAAFIAVLVARPVWFFIFELTVLNAALFALAVWRARANGRFAARIESSL
ncbi:MAG TPA: CDP-alcohol phosphatidyltransferase family protein [Caulobacteraceae bacterium]